MRVLILSLLCVILSMSKVHAQSNFGKVWVNGHAANFITKFKDFTAYNELIDSSGYFFFGDGHSNLCDESGDLLMSSDGLNIYDNKLNRLKGGDTLMDRIYYNNRDGFSGYAQTSILLPFNNKYYFINQGYSDSLFRLIDSLDRAGVYVGNDRLYYHLVTPNIKTGSLEVTSKFNELQHDKDLARVCMTACRHSNGKDWWLLKQGLFGNKIYKYLFREDTVLGPFIQSWDQPNFSLFDWGGQSAFSADGSKYAITFRGAGLVWVADFDRCNSTLSNPKTFEVPILLSHNAFDSTETDWYSEGLNFSPNGRFLYVSSIFNIRQLDLEDPNPATQWYHLAGLDTTWRAFNWYSTIYPGPDGKMYIGNYSSLGGQMSRIDNPNEKGAAAGFCPRCMRFPTYTSHQGMVFSAGVTSPPNMPNYALGAKINPNCAGDYEPLPIRFRLWPNPAKGNIEVEYPSPGRLRLYNLLGQLVGNYPLNDSTQRSKIDLPALAGGIYLYHYHGQSGEEVKGKLLVGP